MEQEKKLSAKINEVIHKTGDYLKTVDVEKIEEKAIQEYKHLEQEYKNTNWQALYQDNLKKTLNFADKCEVVLKTWYQNLQNYFKK